MYQDSAGKCIKRNADPSETHDDGSQNAPPKKVKVIQKSDKTHDPTNDFEQEPTCSYATKSDYMVEEGENNSDEDISYSHNFYDESLTLSPVLVPSARPDRMRIHSESLMCEEQIPPPSHPRTSTPDLMNLSAFGSEPILISDEEMDLKSESFDTYTQRYVAREWNQPMVDHSKLPSRPDRMRIHSESLMCEEQIPAPSHPRTSTPDLMNLSAFGSEPILISDEEMESESFDTYTQRYVAREWNQPMVDHSKLPSRPDRMRIHSESLMCEEQIPPPSHPRTSTPDLTNLSAFGSEPILISDEEMESESFDTYTQRYVAREWNQPMVDHSKLPSRPDRMRIHSESLMCEEQMPPPSLPTTSTPDLMSLSAFGSEPILISDEEMDLESESFNTYTQRYVAWEWNQPMVDHRKLPLSTGDAAPPRTCTVTQPTVSDPTEAGSSSSPRDAFPQ